KRVERSAPERDKGRIRHRNRHDLVDPPIRREAHDPTAIPLCIPDASSVIDARAIGQARLTIERAQFAAVADGAGFRVIVKRPHLSRGRVRKIHRAAVWAETDSVGASDLVEQLRYPTVGIEPNYT